jgi:hypothetical protein
MQTNFDISSLSKNHAYWNLGTSQTVLGIWMAYSWIHPHPTHLGIKRDTLSKFGVKDVVSDRVQTAIKTVYALMGAGLYGLNGINTTISVHMIKCFVIPRLLYGLDVIRLTKTDVTKLSSY